MLRQIVKRTLGHIGLEVHRRSSDDLPYIQQIECSRPNGSEFWIVNPQTQKMVGACECVDNC